MNWFERHLNWTGVIIFPGTCALYVILMLFAAGGYNIDNYLFENRGQVMTVIFLVITYGFIVLNMAGLVWILRKKRLRPWYFLLLLLFVPLLITTYTGFTGHRFDPSPLAFTLMGSLPIPIPWIIVLLLKKRPPVANEVSQPNAGTQLPGWIPGAGIACVILILLAASVYSFIYLKTAATTYEYRYSETRDIPRFSFEHPVSFVLYEYSFSHLRSLLPWKDCVSSCRDDGVFQPSSTELHIGIFPINETAGSIYDYLESEIPLSDMKFFINGVASPYPLSLTGIDSTQISLNSSTINGRDTIYGSLQNPNRPASKQDWGAISLYMFEDRDFTWIIELRDNGKFTEHPPEWFTHLLESFTIYDD